MKIFAGTHQNRPTSLVEISLAKRILGEVEDLSLEELVNMCAETIADLDSESPHSREDEPESVGDDWEYEDWTIEWEGTASFVNFEDRDVNSWESFMTSITIKRAEAWKGDDFSNTTDVTKQLQAALEPYIARNKKEAARSYRY